VGDIFPNSPHIHGIVIGRLGDCRGVAAVFALIQQFDARGFAEQCARGFKVNFFTRLDMNRLGVAVKKPALARRLGSPECGRRP